MLRTGNTKLPHEVHPIHDSTSSLLPAFTRALSATVPATVPAPISRYIAKWVFLRTPERLNAQPPDCNRSDWCCGQHSRKIVGGEGKGGLHDAKDNPHPSGCDAKDVQDYSGGTAVEGMAFSWLLVVWGRQSLRFEFTIFRCMVIDITIRHFA